ncbi:MAG: endonuclease domain-containing protein [Acidimicrobiales bacterium]
MELDVQLRALAERQHGVIARAQARELGADRHHLRRRAASPDWEALTPRVLRLAGAPQTFRQRCMAAALDAGAGAAVSHESAAALWRLPGFPAGAVHVSRAVGRWVHASPLAEIHRTCSLPDAHVQRFEGIPVTSPARSIFDLAGAIHAGRAERALDNALARGLTSVTALHRVTDDLARRGRAGSGLMRRLLADRDAGYVAPESNLEARFQAVASAAGVGPFVRQTEVGGAHWVGRVDFLDPGKRLVVEIDSDLHHTSLLDRAADARRDEDLENAGYRVVRISEHDVWHRPEEVVRRLLAS